MNLVDLCDVYNIAHDTEGFELLKVCLTESEIDSRIDKDLMTQEIIRQLGACTPLFNTTESFRATFVSTWRARKNEISAILSMIDSFDPIEEHYEETKSRSDRNDTTTLSGEDKKTNAGKDTETRGGKDSVQNSGTDTVTDNPNLTQTTNTNTKIFGYNDNNAVPANSADETVSNTGTDETKTVHGLKTETSYGSDRNYTYGKTETTGYGKATTSKGDETVVATKMGHKTSMQELLAKTYGISGYLNFYDWYVKETEVNLFLGLY